VGRGCCPGPVHPGTIRPRAVHRGRAPRYVTHRRRISSQRTARSRHERSKDGRSKDETALRPPDRLDTPDDSAAVRRPLPVSAVCALLAPPAAPAAPAAPTAPADPSLRAEPGGSSLRAEPGGWSDPRTSHRCESSGRVAPSRMSEPLSSSESLSSSGRPKPVGAVVPWCCAQGARSSWALRRRRARLPPLALGQRHSPVPWQLRAAPDGLSRRQLHRWSRTHRAPRGRDETVGGNQQAFGGV
jgi:hypothetical protein